MKLFTILLLMFFFFTSCSKDKIEPQPKCVNVTYVSEKLDGSKILLQKDIQKLLACNPVDIEHLRSIERDTIWIDWRFCGKPFQWEKQYYIIK